MNILLARTKIWPIVAVFVIIASPCNCCVSFIFDTVLQCNKEIIHERRQPIDASPLLDLDIPADADLAAWENWERAKIPPSSGTNVFLHRYDSVVEASNSFEYECKNGWEHPDDWNDYDQSGFTYGGERANRYCASHVVEWRYDSSLLCGPSGEYVSYTIIQNKDTIIAIYEHEDYLDKVSTSTNKAIRELAGELRKASRINKSGGLD